METEKDEQASSEETEQEGAAMLEIKIITEERREGAPASERLYLDVAAGRERVDLDISRIRYMSKQVDTF